MREVAPRAHDVGEPPHDLVALVLAEEPEQIADLLERDLAVERDLARAIHGAHAARADRRELLVAVLDVGAELDLAARRPPTGDRPTSVIFGAVLSRQRAAPPSPRARARCDRGVSTPDCVPIGTADRRHRHRAALAQLLEVRDRALGELGEVAAVDDGLAVGRHLEALVRAIVAQVSRLLEEADVLAERDRDRALAHAADVVVAVLAAVARLRHHVREDEASLFAEDFLRDLGAAFHPREL